MLLQRLTTGVSGWIIIWGSSHELYVFIIVFLTDARLKHPDTIQHNGMTNSEMEMCMWK